MPTMTRRIALTVACVLALALTGSAQQPKGVSLFNGKDLTGWKVPAGDNGHWKVIDGVIDYDAESESTADKNLWSEKSYGDFTLHVDWRIKATPYVNPNVPIIRFDGTHKKDAEGKDIRISVPDSDSDIVHVYEMGEGGPAAELHVAVRPDLPVAQPGAGGVHHVAFRTPNREEYNEWAERLRKLRIPNSGKVNRFYFESLYFREPNGILFEIATDGPGFATDEPMDKLGETLSLPP